MKIAFVSDDGQTISAHYGRAAFVVVVTVESDQVVAREQRPKPAHGQYRPTHAPSAVAPHGHHGPEAYDLHARMADAVADCQMLVSGGMGGGAYANLQQLGIQILLTDERDIESALQAYREGHLAHHPEKLH
jgi:predicted Fe-Mo cluster-binding NifX family protein